jgi:hypothetical protein
MTLPPQQQQLTWPSAMGTSFSLWQGRVAAAAFLTSNTAVATTAPSFQCTNLLCLVQRRRHGNVAQPLCAGQARVFLLSTSTRKSFHLGGQRYFQLRLLLLLLLLLLLPHSMPHEMLYTRTFCRQTELVGSVASFWGAAQSLASTVKELAAHKGNGRPLPFFFVMYTAVNMPTTDQQECESVVIVVKRVSTIDNQRKQGYAHRHKKSLLSIARTKNGSSKIAP